MSYFCQKSILLIRISVIIVNYNARYFLENCLRSVLSSDIAGHVEIIVVDNASSDDSCAMLDNCFSDVRVIQNTENIGFAKANNQAVDLAQGAYLLILNPDTMLTETTLSEMLNFADQQENFGAAGPCFIDGTGSFLPESKRNFPDMKVAGAKLLGYSKYYYASHLELDAIDEVDVLTGAFMFVKKEVYLMLGGFDEDYFMYGEDIDLSYRILKKGYKNFYIGTSKVLHFKGESTIKNKFYLKNFYGALGIFHKKHFQKSRVLYKLVDVLIKTMISIKSIKGVPKHSKMQDLKHWAYLGEDENVFERLKMMHSKTTSVKLSQKDAIRKNCQLMFFDSTTLSYTQIMEAMSRPDMAELRKRIINKNKDFYLGSDSSDQRGEVVRF